MTPVQLTLFRSNKPRNNGELLPIALVPNMLDMTSSLNAAITAFHEHMRQQGFSENTIKAFGGDLNIFRKFIGSNRPVAELTTQDIQTFMHFLRYQRGIPCSMKSYQRRLTSIKVFFNYLYEQGVIETDPAVPVAHQPVIVPLPEILNTAQVECLYKTTRELMVAPKPDVRPHLLVSLLLTTGIKKSEAMGIRLGDIELAHPDQPFVMIRYDDPRRWHKERKLRLPQDFPTTYKQYVEQYQPRERVFECTPRNLEYVLSDVAQMAGLVGKVSFEVLRWTSAVRDSASGMRDETLRQKLGLSTITWQDAGGKIKRLASRPL
ncbi:MAG: phage integrase N-terminal SAM-like domain-containing protein [Anaerolineae bacterium]|nr:phage integrase N-terminal SAM-like domain-containing protein [Anaerolineae bacterium]